jgi:hypothetical protein
MPPKKNKKTKKNVDTTHVPKCQLPKQHESIGCWSVSLVQQIFLSNKSFLSATLNQICCNFFPMKEIQQLSMERLSLFDKFNKKIAGSSPFRFSVAVGQKKGITNRFYQDERKFENDLIHFYTELFSSNEEDSVKKCVMSENVVHIIIFDEYWLKDEKKHKKRNTNCGCCKFSSKQ